MPRLSKEERLSKVHYEALRQFDQIQSAVLEERKQCLQDRRFYSIPGSQWEGLEEQFANKPMFEVNKVHLAVMRIINEYRNNRITVDFVSKDGDKDSELADICDGLYRADEQDSGAEEAYDNAFEEAVGGGFGAYRFIAKYEDEEDEENDDQRIRIEPIYDADSSVFFDLGAKRQDKADAKHCFVITSMTPEAYTEEWGDDPASWDKAIQGVEFDWFTPDVVYVAEYYKLDEKKETILVFANLLGKEEKFTQEELDDEEDGIKLYDQLIATGYIELRSKTVKKRKVRKYILSGNRVLEDCGYIAGKNIPIVPVYGKRWFVDNVERCMGHVRLAKDAQRLKNMQLSKLGEISALSSVSKPILTPDQVSGHQVMWAEDNLKNYPYLLINPVTDMNGGTTGIGPQAYTKAPEIPQALAALLQVTETDIREILGSGQQAEQVVSNISGKAVEMIQSRLDMQTFIYMSNFSKSIRRGGEIWLSMAKDIYTEPGRKMKMIDLQNGIDTVELSKPIVNTDNGEREFENDLADAKFDVVVDVGPSFTSRKEATVRALTGILQMTQDPETQQALMTTIMMNIDGEGIKDVREYFRKKAVTMGLSKPTDEEAEMMKARAGQEDANTTALKAMADQATAEASKARADVIKTITEVEKIKAQTAEILAGIAETEDKMVADKINQAMTLLRGSDAQNATVAGNT
jgi:hypothetical protein